MFLTKIIVTHSAIVLIFAKNSVWASLPDAVCHRLLATACARPATSAPADGTAADDRPIHHRNNTDNFNQNHYETDKISVYVARSNGNNHVCGL